MYLLIIGSVKEIIVGVKDIVLKVNSTIWVSGENAEKTVSIVKSSANLAGAGVSTYNAAEDYLCNDKICFVLSCVGGSCDLISTICGNIPVTKKITGVTVPVSAMCKSTRIYCKKYGTLPGCSNK
jgi:hypothetical protein